MKHIFLIFLFIVNLYSQNPISTPTFDEILKTIIDRATCKFNQAAKPISSKLNFLTF